MKHLVADPRVLLLSCLVTACVPSIVEEPQAEGSSSGSGGDPATTVPLPPAESTTTEPAASSGSTSSATGPDASATAGSSTGPTGLGEGEPCELQLQECAPGLKCMPYNDEGSGASWTASACFPIVPDPVGLGEECEWIGIPWSGYDNCGWGQVCWAFSDGLPGECKGLCLTDDPENDLFETWTCEDPLGIPTIGCQSCFCTCEVPCDPLGQNCDEGQECMPSFNLFDCVPDASGDTGVYGDPCEFLNVCDPGLVCLDSSTVPGCEGAGCCTPLCDITQPNTCPGEGQTCQAWYEPGTAPMGLEDVGACALPP